jgi:hypothetical protein
MRQDAAASKLAFVGGSGATRVHVREEAMASYEDKIKQQAEQYLEPGERVLAAFIAQPRGATTARAGGLAGGAIGGRKLQQQHQSAQEGGLELANPMALALTNSRLVVLGVSQPIALGKGGDVKRMVSAVPLSDVDSIEIKRLLVGKVVIVTVNDTSIKLEAGPGSNAKGLADEFTRTKAPV